MTPAANAAPVTLKGVCRDRAGRVLLCRTGRGEWELPGGRPEPGEAFAACLVREIIKETGLLATVCELIDAGPFEVLPGRPVNVLVCRCEITSDAPPVVSDEHDRVAFIAPTSLEPAGLPSVYRRAIDLARR